jgi:LPPG:FO 2-phospho-L-lactate transferase
MRKNGIIVALAGGVGGAKLVEGFYHAMDPTQLHVIINTGDDDNFYGLHISPDIDTMIYTLANKVNRKKGWGLRKESFITLRYLERFYGKAWFGLGDKDLATHLFRTESLKQGRSLTEATQTIAQKFGIKAYLYPMSNFAVKTIVETEMGKLPFQEYFVKYRHEPKVLGINFHGVENAHLEPQVIDILHNADKIIICPSNPWLSIAPILHIPPIKQILTQLRSKVYVVSPIVDGKALKGPTRRIMDSFGLSPTCVEIAKYYQKFAGHIIIDPSDQTLKPEIELLGMNCEIFPIILRNRTSKKNLAQYLLDL